MDVNTRRRGRPRTYDPDEVLDRAALLFWSKGLAATSLDDLSEAMGMGRPSIHLAFGDKEDLFIRSVARYTETVAAQPLQAWDAAPSIEAGVEGFFNAIVDYTTADPAHSGCLLSSVGAATDSPKVRAFLQAKLEEIEAEVAQRLQQAVDRRELPVGYSAAEGARSAVNAMLAIAMRARVGAPRAELAVDAASASAAVLQLG